MAALYRALLIAAIAWLSSSQELKELPDGYRPGFIIEQTFVPENCDYKARTGDRMFQHYNGTLTDGTVFDTSYQRGRTYNFDLGVNQVIAGIDIGMAGMCKGERRRIVFPPEMGYGNRQSGDIPPGSTLIFSVELADLEPSQFNIDITHKPARCPRKSTIGDRIRIHYNLTKTDGTLFNTSFDSSYQLGFTWDFTLGKNQVIRGIDMAAMDMCVGERRTVTVPPILAYGSRGLGNFIPPHTTLIYHIELEAIEGGELITYKIKDPGCPNSQKVKALDEVSIIYNGKSANGGKTFKNSANNLYKFNAGSNRVMEGVSDTVIGWCKGEKRQIRVNPEKAQGDINGLNLEQNTRYLINVEVVDIESRQLLRIIDTNKDNELSSAEVQAWIDSKPNYQRVMAARSRLPRKN